MAQNPLIKRYLDAGMAFTQMTQARAEAIVKDLVKAGEVQAQRTEELVSALVERSRQNTDKLLDVVRKEVRDQIAGLGLATKDDIARLESKLPAGSRSGSKKSASKKSSSKKKSGSRKSGSRKSGSRKSGSKKSAAKKATKRPAKRTAKKSSGSRSSS